MGMIMRMHSKTLLKKFLPSVNPAEFQFVIISQDVETKDELPNVKALPILMPPAKLIRIAINDDKKSFKKAYLQYMQHPDIEALITILVKAAVKDNCKLVLLCSKSEDEFNYLEYLCEYIEQVFKLKTYSFKEYEKDTAKALEIKNLDEVEKILTKKFEKLEQRSLEIKEHREEQADKLRKELKKYGRKELRKFAKMKNIKVKKDMEKGDLIKKIIKGIYKAS